MTTIPEGEAPCGAGVGEAGSSVRAPPFTEKPLTASAPASTTQRVEPSGERRASSGPTGPCANGVLPRSVSSPPAAIEKLEIDDDAVLTANRYCPSWLIS